MTILYHYIYIVILHANVFALNKDQLDYVSQVEHYTSIQLLVKIGVKSISQWLESLPVQLAFG